MKILKEMLPSIVIAFCMSFMLFVYEPIMMYANNIEEFWFDFSIMLPNAIILFSVVFTIGVMFFCFLYFFSIKIKKPFIYQCGVIAIMVVFIAMYIQGNFLAGMLPPLDGTKINWKEIVPNIVSIFMYIVLIVIAIICCKKFTIGKTIKYSILPTLAIFIMLGVSLISTFMTTNIIEDKDYSYTVTDKNINKASSRQNLMILLVDTVDSQMFNELIESNDKYKEIFNDFTYFPDTLAAYPFTRDSIPLILSGEWNENSVDFISYSTETYKNSTFLNELLKEGYDVNLYESDLVWQDKSVFNINNVESIGRNVKTKTFIKQEIKYVLFKYLPYPLKSFSKIETMDFNLAKGDTESQPFWYGDKILYDYIEQNPIEVEEQKYFQFIHIEGAHTPFDINENLESVDGEYSDKMKATLTVINSYLERLKKYNVYDNSAIIIMSDHGYNFDDPIGRQNPILYIKGINEQHDGMQTSDKSISYVDLCEAYNELISGESSQSIFFNITNDRTRRFLYSRYLHEDHMVEYEITGKAWETEKLIETGNIYDL